MKKEIYKNVAMPPKLFWAPVFPAGINLGVHLPLALISQTLTFINPLYFMFSMVFVHTLIVIWGLKEPHLSCIMQYSNKIKKYGKNPVLDCEKYDYDNATILFKENFMIIFKINNNLSEFSKANYLKEIAQEKLSIRFFYTKENTYLLLSGRKGQEVNNLIQITEKNFPCELLTTSSKITPSDILKLILNPIEDNLFSTGASLSENNLLTNKRTFEKQNELMRFEQNGKTVYTSVLSLQKLENMVDFELKTLLDTNVSILEWIQPKSDNAKMALFIKKQSELARLTNPNQLKEFLEVQEMLNAGEKFVSYGVNIYVSAETVQQLKIKKNVIKDKAKQNGMILTTEHAFLPLTFYMALPQYDTPRQFVLPANVL